MANPKKKKSQKQGKNTAQREASPDSRAPTASKAQNRRDRRQRAAIKAQESGEDAHHAEAAGDDVAARKQAGFEARNKVMQSNWIQDAKKVKGRLVNGVKIQTAGFMSLPGAQETLELLEVKAHLHKFGSNFSPQESLAKLESAPVPLHIIHLQKSLSGQDY